MTSSIQRAASRYSRPFDLAARARYAMRVLLIMQLLWVGSLAAQQQQPEVIALPALTLDGSRIDTVVTYDASRHVYRYQYTVITAATNKTPVHGFYIDVSGRATYTQTDPALVGTAEPLTLVPVQVQPASTLPVA